MTTTTNPTAQAVDKGVSSGTQDDENASPDTQVALDESDDGQVGDDHNDGTKSNREAARYRTKLRTVEAERDALLDQVQALQRNEVERIAGEQLQVAGDLFNIGGIDLADLLTESGEIDANAVAEAVATLLATRPRLGSRPPTLKHYDFGQGRSGRTSKSGGNAWGKLISP